MAALTRDLFIPFVDTTFGAEPGTYEWTRVDKSTIFELSYNPQEETYGYIDSANDTTYTKSYAPELPQEIVLDKDNQLYKKLFPWARKLPIGSSAVVPVMVVYPDVETGKATEADVWKEASISLGSLNTVDGKLSFTLKLNGEVTPGTVTESDGTWTFSPTPAA